jgi:outer membrane protein
VLRYLKPGEVMMQTALGAAARYVLSAGLLLAIPCAAIAQPAGDANRLPHDLTTVYRSALKHDRGYQAALEAFRAAAEAEPQALARLLPELTATGSYNRVRQTIDGEFFGITDVDETDVFDRWAYGASLRQPLFRFEAFLGLDRAELTVGRARLQLTGARHELMLEAAEAYFALLSAQDERRLVHAERSAVQRQNQQVEGSYEAGLVAESDLMAVRAQLDRIRAREIAADNRIEIARSRLESLVGSRIGPLARFRDTSRMPEMEFEALQPWLEKAERHNIPLLTESVGLRLADLDTRIARSNHYPTLDLVGSHAFFDADGGFEGAREDRDSRVGVVLSIPIFEGGATVSQTRQARARARAQEHKKADARAQARLATREAFLNARAARSRAEALERAVESARSAEESTRVAFDTGSRTAADYLIAVRERFRAERDLSQARYDYILDLLRLRRAAGVMTVTDLTKLNRSLQ